MAWDPATYLRFSDERLRPGFDLLARVGDLPPGPLAEFGCGTGVHARAIAERWPGRAFTAIDSSPEMLKQASATPSSIRWEQADLRSWAPPEKVALVFSNAVLQWVDEHETLFPRLMGLLAPGGVLAVQMPRNFDAPSHVLMREAAQAGSWAATLKPLLRPDPVAAPEVTYDRLAPLGAGRPRHLGDRIPPRAQRRGRGAHLDARDGAAPASDGALGRRARGLRARLRGAAPPRLSAPRGRSYAAAVSPHLHCRPRTGKLRRNRWRIGC